jgi:hypothetical protein
MYLLDLWRGQTSSDIWIEAWCDLVRKWRPALWAEEQGQIISGVGPYLERRAKERQAYTCREQFVSRSDKAVSRKRKVGVLPAGIPHALPARLRRARGHLGFGHLACCL